MADAWDEMERSPLKSARDEPALLRVDVVFTVDDGHRSGPCQQEVFAVCSPVERTDAGRDRCCAHAGGGMPRLFDHVSGDIGAEQRTPVLVPRSSEAVIFEQTKGVVTKVRLLALPTGGDQPLPTDGHLNAGSDRLPDVRERGIPALR